MSMTDEILKSIQIAKTNLGDLLRDGTLKQATGSTYVGGVYTKTTIDVSVKLVIDQFTFEEIRGPDFQQTDVKISVFNNDTYDLAINIGDSIEMDGAKYTILTCSPAYVGSVKALYELVLRR